jgi:hypothetical protein
MASSSWPSVFVDIFPHKDTVMALMQISGNCEGVLKFRGPDLMGSFNDSITVPTIIVGSKKDEGCAHYSIVESHDILVVREYTDIWMPT